MIDSLWASIEGMKDDVFVELQLNVEATESSLIDFWRLDGGVRVPSPPLNSRCSSKLRLTQQPTENPRIGPARRQCAEGWRILVALRFSAA